MRLDRLKRMARGGARASLVAALLLAAAAPAAALDKRTLDAVATANFALNDNDCGRLIDGPTIPGTPPGFRSKTVLSGIVGNNMLIERPNEDPKDANGRSIAALSRLQGGEFGRITLFRRFFDGFFSPDDFAPPVVWLVSSEVQAVVLLHEVAHSTGSLGDDRTSKPIEFNSAIVDLCIRPTDPVDTATRCDIPPPEGLFGFCIPSFGPDGNQVLGWSKPPGATSFQIVETMPSGDLDRTFLRRGFPGMTFDSAAPLPGDAVYVYDLGTGISLNRFSPLGSTSLARIRSCGECGCGPWSPGALLTLEFCAVW